MSLQDLGALGEVVGGIAVVLSLIYVAYQIRQSSHQIDLNSRHIKASMYHATNDNFFRWFSLLAQDEELSNLWRRGLQGESLTPEEKVRHHSLSAMLFLAYESNFEQLKLGTVQRDSLGISRANIVRLLSSPTIREWWVSHAVTTLTPEFRESVDTLVEAESSRDENAA